MDLVRRIPVLTGVELDSRLPSLGDAARRLQRDAMETFIEMVQELGDTDEFRLRASVRSPVNTSSCFLVACAN
jgi:hypothetical protein